MKNLKNYLKLSVLMMALVLVSTSCSDDDEETPVFRADFIGTFSTNEVCRSGTTDSYDMVIRPDESTGAGPNDILITNLYNKNQLLEGQVIDANTMLIPHQTRGTITYLANGTRNGNVITLDFTVAAGGISDLCQATMTKQP
ncbi:MAG: hypothetical protein HEP71_30240 [Roseivirga sp.]|nr:hypothetical protein [Roseivirga sp.]